jgi:hypothetical protein
MSRKTSISRLLRAVKRRGDRVVAQDTTPPLSSSPDVTAADAAARSQAPVPSATSTCSGREADTQWKPVDHGNEEPVIDAEKCVQDTEAETTTDSPLVHRIISGVHKLVDSVSRLHLRPKSRLDTSSDALEHTHRSRKKFATRVHQTGPDESLRNFRGGGWHGVSKNVVSSLKS